MMDVECCGASCDSIDAVGCVQTLILAYLRRTTADGERKPVFNGILTSREEKVGKHLYQIQSKVALDLSSVFGLAMVIFQVRTNFQVIIFTEESFRHDLVSNRTVDFWPVFGAARKRNFVSVRHTGIVLR